MFHFRFFSSSSDFPLHETTNYALNNVIPTNKELKDCIAFFPTNKANDPHFSSSTTRIFTICASALIG